MSGRVSHVAVGNLNIDMYIVVEEIPGPDEDALALDAYIGPGGAAANYAVAAAKAGSRVALAAHTGRMAVELGILSNLERAGVDTSLVRIHNAEKPGLIVILVSSRGGERSMVTMKGANRLLEGSEAKGSFDVLHVASHGPQVLNNARNSCTAGMVSYDPGAGVLRRLGRGALEGIGRVNVLYLNRAEYRMVTGSEFSLDSFDWSLAKVAEIVVVKLGAEGAVAATAGGKLYRVEAYQAGSPVDTTGAGDVFAAYMNTYLAEGGSVEDALAAASVAAGIKVSRRGAQSAPSREEVEEALRSQGRPRVQRLR